MSSPERAVLVVQQRIGEDTAHLAGGAPRLWRYLTAHSSSFTKRQSSIYRGGPAFAMFGVGPYSFAPFKVATGGLNKQPHFQAIGPKAGKPVMLDDTCYFLPCPSASETAILTALCNDPITIAFLRAASFQSAKRPVTKALLDRIDFLAILERIDRKALEKRAREIEERDLHASSEKPMQAEIERLEDEFAQTRSRARQNPKMTSMRDDT